MKPHQERVVQERKELEEKLQKLSAFISSSVEFQQLPADEKGRLLKQEGLMIDYRDVLSARIANFK